MICIETKNPMEVAGKLIKSLQDQPFTYDIKVYANKIMLTNFRLDSATNIDFGTGIRTRRFSSQDWLKVCKLINKSLQRIRARITVDRLYLLRDGLKTEPYPIIFTNVIPAKRAINNVFGGKYPILIRKPKERIDYIKRLLALASRREREKLRELQISLRNQAILTPT